MIAEHSSNLLTIKEINQIFPELSDGSIRRLIGPILENHLDKVGHVLNHKKHEVLAIDSSLMPLVMHTISIHQLKHELVGALPNNRRQLKQIIADLVLTTANPQHELSRLKMTVRRITED